MAGLEMSHLFGKQVNRTEDAKTAPFTNVPEEYETIVPEPHPMKTLLNSFSEEHKYLNHAKKWHGYYSKI